MSTVTQDYIREARSFPYSIDNFLMEEEDLLDLNLMNVYSSQKSFLKEGNCKDFLLISSKKHMMINLLILQKDFWDKLY